MSSDFRFATENLQRRLEEARGMVGSSSPAALPEGAKAFATTAHASTDGYIAVTVSDGQLDELTVDGQWFRETHPTTAWHAVRKVINEALAANSRELVAAMREANPGVEAIQELVAKSSADFSRAFQNLLDRS